MTVRADETSQDGQAERPLRRDAERNRQRILAAAAEVFTERGLDATLDEVARAAGVGVGTVYRRFPDKESLIAALFRDRIDTLAAMAEEASAARDPWQGLVTYLEFIAGAMAGDLGLRQLIMFATYDRDQVCYVRDRMRPAVSRLVERAQAAGDLRDDFQPTDVKMIAFMLASIAEYAAPVARRRLPAAGGRPHRAQPRGPDDRAGPAARPAAVTPLSRTRLTGVPAGTAVRLRMHVHPHAKSFCAFSGAYFACMQSSAELPIG
jgi:AcrR family transcriptional regulator